MSAPHYSRNGSATTAADALNSPPARPPLVDGRNDLNYVFVHSKLDDFGLSSSQFRVYGHIARRASSGTAWPSIASMATVCGLNPQTVRRAVAVLVKHQLITREPRPGHTPFYRLTPASLWMPLTGIGSSPCISNTTVSNADATPTKPVKGHPCETNVAKGNPVEGNPRKNNIHTTLEPARLPTSEAEAVEAAKLLAIPEDFARNEFNGRAAVGWVNGAGIAIKSWTHYLKKRWSDEQSQRAERATRPSSGRAVSSRSPAPPRQFTPDDYK